MRRARDLSLTVSMHGLRLDLEESLVDLLFARCAIFRGRDCLTETGFRSLTETYRELALCPWKTDPFAEREELLTWLSFAAWSQCLRYRSYEEMQSWERKCAEHVLAMESVRGFFDLPLGRRSKSLCDRFLGDPAVLLALCHRLSDERNRSPVRVASEAAWALGWLAAHDTSLLSSELSYITGEIALSAASATRHLGKLAESRAWIEHAERAIAACEDTARFLSKVEFARLSIMYDRVEMFRVISRAPGVIAKLARLGPSRELSRCRFMEASALKNVGRKAEAQERLEALLRSESPSTDPLLFGLALVSLGEVEASQQDYEQGINHIKSALPCLAMSATPWALAHLTAALGEVLRDRGNVAEAIESFEAAVASYSRLQMEWHLAYVRNILAESLIATGREQEAEAELLAALPILEREQIVPAAVAAIGLLRESLARQRAVDAQTLRRLRESLESSLGGTQL
jgi:tetratricopeptide (TPR) repeat protein